MLSHSPTFLYLWPKLSDSFPPTFLTPVLMLLSHGIFFLPNPLLHSFFSSIISWCNWYHLVRIASSMYTASLRMKALEVQKCFGKPKGFQLVHGVYFQYPALYTATKPLIFTRTLYKSDFKINVKVNACNHTHIGTWFLYRTTNFYIAMTQSN